MPANIRYIDKVGSRETKHSHLTQETARFDAKSSLNPVAPYYFFRNFDHEKVTEYYNGFSVEDLFTASSSGTISANDGINYSFSRSEAEEKIRFIVQNDESAIRKHFGLKSKDARDWTVPTAKTDAQKHFGSKPISKILYRPFDSRHTLYTGTSRGLYASPQKKIAWHIRGSEAPALITTKVNRGKSTGYVLCTPEVFDFHIFDTLGDSSSAFPLYLYPSEQDLDQTRRINFDPKLYRRLQTLAQHPTHGTPDEVQVFDYIYGVLHCPDYRSTYAEFLKIDFPRIPWPANPHEFWEISDKGQTLRKLHLMDPDTIGPAPYPFKGEGDGTVGKPRYEDGKVWINATQYFDTAPEVSWGFYIGGYQPAQKWLKDRKGRALSFEDVRHYQRILKILVETDRIMGTISMTLGAGGQA